MNFTEQDIELVKKFVNIRKRGLYASGQQVTDVYNRVLDKNLRPTNCSSCISQRISELERALNKWESQNKAEEKEAAQAADNERGEKGETECVPLENNKKKRGRPKKKEE